MKAGDWAVLAVVAAIFCGMGWFMLQPAPGLPAGTVNGSYANPCCETIRLSDGAIFVGSKRVAGYMIEWGKKGPRIRPDTRIIVRDGRRLEVGGGSPVRWRFGNGAIELTNGASARYLFTQAPAR
jgi:hypothetical protein